MLTFKHQEKSISGIEALTLFALQFIFKLLVGVISFYSLSWLFKDIELKTLLFLLCACILAWNSKLTFRS